MKILNALERAPKDGSAAARATCCTRASASCCACSSPITPHISHQLWRELGFGEDILDAPLARARRAALIEDEIELVVQVNGKLRGDIRVPRDAAREAIEKRLAIPRCSRFLRGPSGEEGHRRARPAGERGGLSSAASMDAVRRRLRSFGDSRSALLALCWRRCSSGCGFQLRGTAHLPFSTLYVQAPTTSQLATS